MAFCFVQKFFFGQHESQNIFFPPEFNIRLYDKNSESAYFFFLHQNQNIFFQHHWESEYFFQKKNITPPPLQVKWSFPQHTGISCITTYFWKCMLSGKYWILYNFITDDRDHMAFDFPAAITFIYVIIQLWYLKVICVCLYVFMIFNICIYMSRQYTFICTNLLNVMGEVF